MKTAVDHLEKLESEITELLTELYELFSATAAGDGVNDQNVLDRYIKHIARIGLHVRKSDIDGLQEFCITFQEILRGIRSQQRNLTAEEREQLEIWPSLVLSAINAPKKSEYIQVFTEYMDNPIWADVIDQEKMTRYQDTSPTSSADDLPVIRENAALYPLRPEVDDTDTLMTEPLPDNSEVDELEGNTFDNSFFESVQQEILEATSELLSDLVEETNEAAASLTLCADRIEILAASIAESGYMGLMDVCGYYQLGLRQLAKQAAPLSSEQILSIETLPAQVLSYIACPEDTTNTDSIIQFLKETPWITSFADPEAELLKELLVPEKIEIKQLDEETGAGNQSEQNTTEEHHKKISLQTNELINLVIDEINIEKETLESCIKILLSDTGPSAATLTALSDYNSIIARFALALESVGLSGLYKILSHVSQNLEVWTEKQTMAAAEVIDFLARLPGLILGTLSNMENPQYAEALVNALVLPEWTLELKTDKQSLLEELLSPELIVEEEQDERPTTASAEDVSLALPDDVNQQLLNSLLQELPLQTAEFSSIVSKIYSGEADLQDIQHAQRIAHTLKGAANTVGVVGVATLTHHIEDILTAFTKDELMPGKELSDILMNAADVLEMMSEALLGIGEVPGHARSILQQILDWANRIDLDGIPQDSAAIPSPAQLNTKPSGTVADSKAGGEEETQTTMLRVPATLMDELLRLAGESIIMGAQLQERLKQATLKNEQAQQQNELFQQLVFELEQIVDVQLLTSEQGSSELATVFDALELEQYNELHTISHRLVEAATDSRELSQSINDELSALDGLLAEQGHIHKESQDVVMQTRMVPIQNIVPRLQRSIRQTCRFTGKQAQLEVNGAEIMMDSDVLNEIAEPLMHILRNAVDHGIEPPESRKSRGKTEAGNITLDFRRDGEQIVIRCSDDGAGLDFSGIRMAAIKNGQLDEAADISDDELIRYIWKAGFTTADATTQVSGRGIGMDVVYNRITSMKGTLKIESEKDLGCSVEIHLPLTLISVHSILVKHYNQTLALSNRGIEQILGAEDGVIEEHDGTLKYHHGEMTYDAFDIENLLHQSLAGDDRSSRSILLINDETGKPYAITVQQVLANQDLVVKQLGLYVPEIAGIEGATILGDGHVVPVLDLPGLIRTVHQDGDLASLFDANGIIEPEPTVETIDALIVDDSLSARRSLAEFVEDIGYTVRTARDGIDALDRIEEKLPDILLVDLEMPRMNGLELTSHLRANEQTRSLPVIMVTSRSTEKHRKTAISLGVNAYITKPFSEDELLDNIDRLLSHVD